jgi:hypothetical protein
MNAHHQQRIAPARVKRSPNCCLPTSALWQPRTSMIAAPGKLSGLAGNGGFFSSLHNQ